MTSAAQLIAGACLASMFLFSHDRAFGFGADIGFMQVSDGVNEQTSSIAVGGKHVCALLANASVRCWGLNSSGQLGYDRNDSLGGLSGSMNALNSVNLGIGKMAKAIDAGDAHTCAILDDDSLKCWGNNASGQLGLEHANNMGDSSGEMATLTAINLGAGRTAKAVTAGLQHTCAILDNNAVKCWGANGSGQLGLDNETTLGNDAGHMASLGIVNLGSGRTAKAIDAGGYHTCAILDDDTLKCWGKNASGQLGLDDTTDRGKTAGSMAALATVQLGAGRTAKAISVGADHSCAILDNNALKCWGLGDDGRLGLGHTDAIGKTAGSMATLPTVDLGVGRTAKKISAGTYHTCAILDNDAVKCWGRNASGQLGLNDVVYRGNTAEDMKYLAPVGLGAGRSAKAIGVGARFTCALLNNNELTCWGLNDAGQLGLSDKIDRGANSGTVASLPPIAFAAGRTVKAVQAGWDFTCAIFDDDSLRCWGNNSIGQLGQDSTTRIGMFPGEMAALPAVNLGPSRKAKKLAVGKDHVCVILDNDQVKCWGNNACGILGLDHEENLGDSPGEMAALPTVNLGSGRTAKAITAGTEFTCAILDTNQVKCWGSSGSGRLGLDDTSCRGNEPGEMAVLQTVNLGSGRTAKAISARSGHACAILDDDTLKCWGNNDHGQLGLGNTTAQGKSAGDMANLPTVNLGSGRTAKSVSVGWNLTCVILDNDSIKCWGKNTSGELGRDDTTSVGTSSATEVALLSPVNIGAGHTPKALITGNDHVCVVLDTNQLKCWGRNDTGALGVDRNTNIGVALGDMAALPTVNLGTGRTVHPNAINKVACGVRHTCAVLDDSSLKCWGINEFGQIGTETSGGTWGAGGSPFTTMTVELP